MRIVINSDCAVIPDGAQLFTSEGSALLNFLSSLGYDAADPPLADLLRRYHHLEGEWLILSPVHWKATHNDAMIVAQGKDLQLQEFESRSWFNLFSQYLVEEGDALYYHNAETWLLRNVQKHSLNAKPVHHLVHQSLMPELAHLDKSMYWQKFITESQMLFASRSNQTLMNGLWAWGGATLCDRGTVNICVDEHFLSIAQICSSNVTLYNPSLKLNEYQILLLTEISLLSEQHQEELKKITVYWHWNNVGYTVNTPGWLTRLWRKLIHAN